MSQSFFPKKNYSKLSHDAIVSTHKGVSDVSTKIGDVSEKLSGVANGIQSLGQKQELTNHLLKNNMELSIQTNENLQVIDNTLNSIGFVLQDIYSTNEAQNQILREQNKKLDNQSNILIQQTDILLRQTSSIERQEKLQVEKYLEVKKEKDLKEVLYNIKKYIENCKKLNDSISAAYGSKQLLELIKGRNFTTKDLANIDDKEFYDERIKDSEIMINSLSDSEKDTLFNFEITYSGYQDLKLFDIEDYIKNQYPEPTQLFEPDLSKINIQKPVIPQLFINKLNKPGIKFENSERIFSKEEIDELVNWYNKNSKIIKYTLLINPIATFLVFLILAINAKNYFEKIVLPIFVAQFFVIPFGIFNLLKRFYTIGKYAILYKVTPKDLKKKLTEYIEELKNYELENEKYKKQQEDDFLLKQKMYDDEIEKYNEKVKEEERKIFNKTKDKNEEIIRSNEKLRQEKETLIKNHFLMLDEMRKIINEFLDLHPPMQKFLPKV